ncbi:HAD family phosphatase [Cognatishimia sp. WU-CL00825]|uniref:HAD-IA family hydrolase n=1 Tax=Cognatishimia sp. WU-CL00825 TaxID=3127658 RepID=UPI00310A78D8
MTIQAVIFDVGNVLIEWNPERFYDRVIGIEKRTEMFAELDMHDMNNDIDLGAPFQQRIYDFADENPKWGDEIRMWHDNWFELASPAIDHSWRLLRALRTKGIKVFALSNFGVDNWPPAVKVYPVLGEFDREFISGRMQMVKPFNRIYEKVEEDTGIEPDQLIFTDDRADNIATARARGWKTHLFDGPQGWAERLVAEGLLSETEAA